MPDVLLPSCFGDPHVSSETAASSGSPGGRSAQNMVTCLYRALIDGEYKVLSVTWLKTLMGQGLLLQVDDPSCQLTCYIDMKPWLFWKKQGSKAFETGFGSKLEVVWDLSSARYGSGPEPKGGFFVCVVCGRKVTLLLGDMRKEALKKVRARRGEEREGSSEGEQRKEGSYGRRGGGGERKEGRSYGRRGREEGGSYGRKGEEEDEGGVRGEGEEGENQHEEDDDEEEDEGEGEGRAVLVSRREHVSGSRVYATRARFFETGGTHDIVIECHISRCESDPPRLSVRVDKKVVVHVKRLMWKFRGNQTIVVDGEAIEVFWDVHNWLFSSPNSSANEHAAIFMFQACRSNDKPWMRELGHASSPPSPTPPIAARGAKNAHKMMRFGAGNHKVRGLYHESACTSALHWPKSNSFKSKDPLLQQGPVGFSLLLFAWRNE